METFVDGEKNVYTISKKKLNTILFNNCTKFTSCIFSDAWYSLSNKIYYIKKQTNM